MSTPLHSVQSYPPALLLLDADGPHLINTSKVIRGHKLRLKQYVKVQMLKSAHLSPSKIDCIPPRQAVVKCGGYGLKYQWRQIENEEQMARQVQRMRAKNSRQCKERMKLFTDSRKLRKQRGHQSVKTQLMITRNAPQSRNSYQSAKTQNTSELTQTQNPMHPSSSLSKDSPIEFISANLGKRMNQYLNIVLAKKQAQVQPMQTIKFQQYEKKIPMPIHHKRTTNFVRKMKISQKSKHCLLSSSPSPSISPSKILQPELVKSIMRKTPREQLSVDISLSDWKADSNFYSIDLNSRSKNSSKYVSALPTYRTPMAKTR